MSIMMLLFLLVVICTVTYLFIGGGTFHIPTPAQAITALITLIVVYIILIILSQLFGSVGGVHL